MINSEFHSTPRLTTHCLVKQGGAECVLFLHGNVSSSVFWEETLSKFSSNQRLIAPDLRGFGKSSAKKVDATRGLLDFVDDIVALLDHLEIDRCHLVGHSLGSNIIFSIISQFPERVHTATLVSPGSPYGFGGVKGKTGDPCWSDFSGSGAGLANAEFVQRLHQKDDSNSGVKSSPRAIMNTLYWDTSFKASNEDQLLQAMFDTKLGDSFYPGDFENSPHYPFFKPGNYGPMNATSPKYNTQVVPQLIECSQKPPILWIRGDKDRLVSNYSLVDSAVQGKLGYRDLYPGVETFPPQPMIDQIEFVLEEYGKKGGATKSIVVEGAGHSPHIEKPKVFLDECKRWIQQ